MTTIYFVRHAAPDYSVHDDLIRPLNENGIEGSKKIREFLSDKNIDKIYSSPLKRSIDTVKPFACKVGLSIETIDDLRERKISDCWLDDFDGFAEKQWSDFEYKLENGECLREVQQRNINVLSNILENNCDKNIVIATHGTALSTIVNYYNNKFDYNEFYRIKAIMPWVVCMKFQGKELISIEETSF